MNRVKLYQNGSEFYQDNTFILDKYPLDTSFMLLNSKTLSEFSKESYAFKAYNDKSYLLVLRLAPFATVVFGDKNLCAEAVKTVIKYNLNVNKMLTSKDLYITFYDLYIKKIAGSYLVHHEMDIMFATNCNDVDTSMVKRASSLDINKILVLEEMCSKEIDMDNGLTKTERIKKIETSIHDYYYVERDNQIVSIAKKTRNEEKICAISCVYTKPEYRCFGYSRKVVTQITKEILKEHKIAYLYVDKKNPISNHLYTSIGYNYGNAKYEVSYSKK